MKSQPPLEYSRPDEVIQPAPRVIMPPKGPFADLLDLRSKFPFVPIMAFPMQSASVVLAAGVAQELRFPDGTVLCIFTGNGDYYVSASGGAVIPTAANPNPGSIFRPEYSWFYTPMQLVSVIAPNAGTIVQAQCFIPYDFPQYS